MTSSKDRPARMCPLPCPWCVSPGLQVHSYYMVHLPAKPATAQWTAGSTTQLWSTGRANQILSALRSQALWSFLFLFICSWVTWILLFLTRFYTLISKGSCYLAHWRWATLYSLNDLILKLYFFTMIKGGLYATLLPSSWVFWFGLNKMRIPVITGCASFLLGGFFGIVVVILIFF